MDNRTSKDSAILDSGRKIRATDSATAIAIQDARDTAMPVGRDLPAASNPEAESEQLVIRYGASDVTLAAAGFKPVVSDNTDEGTAFYVDLAGEKAEKWREMYDVRKAVEKDWDASMMVSGMDRRNYLQDLAGMAMKEGAEQEVVRVKRERTGDEQESGGGPHCSEDLTIDAIQNPSVLPIRTASEWDPGPRDQDDATPAANAGKDLFTTFFPEPMDLAAAEHKIRQADILNGRQWFRCWRYNGHCKLALWKIGGALIGGSDGNRVWDPGGGRAESLSMAGRWRNSVKASGMGCDGGERVGRACREASIWVLRCLWSHGDVVASCRGRRYLFVWACGEK